MWKVAPLKSSFMLASLLGLLISIVYTLYGRISTDWGFALGFLFFLMLIASLISMTYSPIEVQVKMAPDFVKEQPKKKSPRRKALRTAVNSGFSRKKPSKKKAAKPKKVKKAKPAKKAAKKKRK